MVDEKTLARIQPFGPMTSLEHPFDRMFQELWHQPLVKAEVPGLSEDDLEVILVGSTLTIKGERKQEEKFNHGDYLYSERLFGSFRRSIELPTEGKADKADASFKNGVLELHLPKSEDAKQKGKGDLNQLELIFGQERFNTPHGLDSLAGYVLIFVASQRAGALQKDSETSRASVAKEPHQLIAAELADGNPGSRGTFPELGPDVLTLGREPCYL